MNEIKKIIVSGQILRPKIGYIIYWFHNLLGYYLKTVANLPVQVLFPQDFTEKKEVNGIYFDINKFYSFYGYSNYENLDEKNKNEIWAKIFYNKAYNKEAYEYVYSVFKDSLVVVHELEQTLVDILEHYSIPYIDINTDPVRFLDDQLFAFRTNIKAICDEIIKFRIDEELFYMYANYQSLTYKSNFVEDTNQKIVLFLGQTDCDKTLIDPAGGEIYSILDHKEEFENALKGFDNIYYKRHPMARNDEEVVNYIKSIGDIEITDENFYKLMSRDDIKKVVSISSGTCIEAKYFGKESKVLLRDSINLNYGSDFDKEKYISIYQDFFSLNFWSKILSPIVETKTFSEKVNFYGQKNKLRNSRGAKCYWGYEDFEQEIVKNDLMPFYHELNANHWELGSKYHELGGFHWELVNKVGQLEQKLNEVENGSFRNYCKKILRTITIGRFK